MVAQLAAPPVVRTEVRGAVARLWRYAQGEIVISGPAGTGKTMGILLWIHQRCQQERLRVLFLRKTQESLKASALVTFQEQVLHAFDGKQSAADGVRYFGGNDILPPQFTYEDTGSTIVLGGMDRPSKVLSTEYDIIYINEATELTSEQWEQLGGRTDRPRLGPERPPSLLLGDCNPNAPTHWIKQRADEGKLRLWPTTHRDNPAMWDRITGAWTRAGRIYLMRLRNFTGVLRQRMLYGRWVAAEGQVLETWDDALHLAQPDAVTAWRAQNPWYFGTADWGWTKPGVLQVYAVDSDDRLLQVAEFYQTRRTVDGWWVHRAVELSDEFGFLDWICDPSEPQYIDIFKSHGLNARGAVNDLLPGITATLNRLQRDGTGRPRLMVAANALRARDEALADAKLPTSTLTEIPVYVWPKGEDGRIVKEKPVDEHNHAIDCLRYAVAHLDLSGGVVRPLDPQLAAAFAYLPG